VFAVLETVERSVFDGIFSALDAASRPVVGPADPRLLAIPIRDGAGAVIGGLWGTTLFRWFEIEMLVVPPPMRQQGIGSALLEAAEAEAKVRGCIGACVDTISFQAGPFYLRRGFTLFGALDDCPPGHRRLFFSKRLD
jgi:GNAT superfamily N-acetyltransferase